MLEKAKALWQKVTTKIKEATGTVRNQPSDVWLPWVIFLATVIWAVWVTIYTVKLIRNCL